MQLMRRELYYCPMQKGYTIYFGDKPYHIVNRLNEELYRLANRSGTIIANHPDQNMVTQTIRDMEKQGTRAVILLTDEYEHYWKLFQNHFTPVLAGGGIVFNEKKELLFIYRRKKWDLPKGKLDEGETIEACALREVKEETGLKEVALKQFIGNTYHTYHEKGRFILKTSSWYLMQANGNQELIPQTEEDIEEMVWLSESRWEEVFTNTFPAIRQILEQLPAL
jgi:8-oxo-dGTP pyrophosphatase MutT (NUDIX family)